LSRLDALRAALQGERRGYEFYYSVAGTTTKADIRAAANEFVHEEAEHVKILEAWITREEWKHKTGG
jgi:rubrerythrin